MFKRLFSILLILVMVLSFSSCESGLSAQIVNGAIESLDKITTYQYDMNVNVDIVYGTFEGVISTEFNGVFDVENEQMEMDINMSSIFNGDEGQRVGEMYLIDNIVYENVTLIVNDVHDMGPMWTKREMPAGYWEEMNQVKVQIELLEGAVQVEVIGSDEVRGIDCYVLEIIPDMEKFWQTSMQQPEVAMLPGIDEEFLQEVFKGFSMKQWIEKDTYFLAKAEIETALELTPEALGSPEEQGLITQDITIDLMVYNYNQPVSIILPQEAEEAPEMPKYTTTTIIVTEPATTVIEPSWLIIDTYFDVDEEIVTIVGKEFAIALYSVQRFNMYRWDVSYDEEMVALSERTWKAYEGQFIADEGKEWFIFKALKDGTTEITFTYIQSSSESVIEEKVFKIDIRIR